jgi:hypothetical protein
MYIRVYVIVRAYTHTHTHTHSLTHTHTLTYTHTHTRSAWNLWALGVFLNNGYDLPNWRVPGVLQRYACVCVCV